MDEMIITFNGNQFAAKFNEQTGYYELELKAPAVGGIYKAEIEYTDAIGEKYEDEQVIQVFAKEKIKIDTNKVVMWIFDFKDFSIKDILEVYDYEINIDEETNANSIVRIAKKTSASAQDIVFIKENGNIIYWGIIDNIQIEDGKQCYEYTLKYITNMFNEKVQLTRNIEDEEIEEGVYRIKSSVAPEKVLDVVSGSMESEATVQLWTNNNTSAQKWRLKNYGDYWSMQCVLSGKFLDLKGNLPQNEQIIYQYNENNTDAQRWKIDYINDALYKIAAKSDTTYFIDLAGASPEEGTKIQSYKWNDTLAQKWYLERLDEFIINDVGVEDFIAKAINDNFINSKDTLANKSYLEVRVKTHTKLKATVSNVENNMYYLTTFMTNCMQLYNINYNFFIENKKLIIEIENKTSQKELINLKAQAITNYNEVFTTDVISKVEVVTNTKTYYLYLKNDRTTTTNKDDTNRAAGKTERIFTENFEDAEQKALDAIKTNSYDHNVTFSMYGKYMAVGTPIAIKTKDNVILNTYISALRITPSKKVIDYTCGNIRIDFIDKILKERNE